MSRIPSSVTACLWNMAGCWFLLAFSLAGSNVRSGKQAPLTQRVHTLSSQEAANLLIHVAKPSYPAIAKVNFIQGPVELAITVNDMGRVITAHVVEGEPLLAVAAIDAVRKWVYKPYVSSEGPAPFSTNVVVNFTLRSTKFRSRTPQNAEKDLERQIQPPEAISPVQSDPAGSGVQLKVLVDQKGEVVDASSGGIEGPEIDQARKNLESWKFRPARWGAIPVPWYITVKVPVGRTTIEDDANRKAP
ncbi:MAG TPA: TonB family protein [Terriglobia bacterium]|nr:TonB family protein [Terriglobia bacterium]